MTLQQALHGVETLSQAGNLDVEISGVQYDSRRVEAGNLFVAMRGETTDGNRYIDAALGKGAVAVISDSAQEQPRKPMPWVTVAHGRRALGVVSANFFQCPAEKLKLVGVTGTNGKTTTTFLLESMLNASGLGPVALIGTIEYHVAGRVIPAPHTTPESLDLNRMLAEATAEQLGPQRAKYAVMEVSSHALAQERVHGLSFAVAVFSNLTRDHLDYHADMQDYFASKRRLFEGTGGTPPRAAVINADDEYGRELLSVGKKAGSKVFSYGIKAGDFRAEKIQLRPDGLTFLLTTPSGAVEISAGLVGQVNVYNFLAACTSAHALGMRLEQLPAAAAACKPVPGRFEQVQCGQPFAVVVDYAHTDDALRNLTRLARDFVTRNGRAGRVITLFGCGGDRDRNKRPLMGKAAGRGSDFCVLTSDNPRSEDPMAIIRDALPGLESTHTAFLVEPDRRKAIAVAIREAKSGDIVLLAGKGHEKVQVTRAGTAPFDDVQVACQALAAAGYGASVGKSTGGRK
jgi:UDP-N-acetylmuramoyl-L-alanyl-D-glutamate--2,6-diaminopimelate ligase